VNEGVSDRRLPWLLRTLFQLVVDGLEQELQALEELDAPRIDAFIRWDPVLASTHRSKYVRAVADYLAGGYSSDDSRIFASEYEIAYLRNRVSLRGRITRQNLEELFLDIGEH